MIKKLVAFDFDGTLSDSPMPQVGKEIWSRVNGKEYPHKGWWGKAESLDTDVFDIKLFKAIEKRLRAEIADKESYVIILTSRMEKLRPQLERILADNKIVVDKLDMKYGPEKTKGEKILDYTKKFPKLSAIDVYDDRKCDIDSYKEIRAELPDGIQFKIYLAEEGKVSLVESNSKILNIIREELRKLF